MDTTKDLNFVLLLYFISTGTQRYCDMPCVCFSTHTSCYVTRLVAHILNAGVKLSIVYVQAALPVAYPQVVSHICLLTLNLKKQT